MRKFKYIALIAPFVLALVVACEHENPSTEFSIGTPELTMGAEGGIETIRVNSDGPWIANATVPWITVSPANGYGSVECEVKVDTTLLSSDIRQGVVRFTDEASKNVDLNVTQMGYENMIVLSTTEVNVPNYAKYGSRYFDITLTSNVPFSLNIPEDAKWLNVADYDFTLDRGARPRSVKLRFNWDMNNRPQERVAEVTFTPADGIKVSRQDALKVIQAQADEIPDSREGDSLAIVGCCRSLGINLAQYEGEKMDKWSFVALWDPLDEDFTEDKRGRVKYVRFSLLNTNDGVPYEVQFLTKLQTLSFFSNRNSFLKRFHSGEYISKLTQLKSLQLFSFGLVELDDDFANLKNLEYLDISSNNFNEFPRILTPENFPKLKYIDICANRNYGVGNLNSPLKDRDDWGGLNRNDAGNFPTWLLKWENLEYLRLSNNFMQGEIPDMEDYEVRWTEEEVAANDTLPHGNNNPAHYNLVGKPKVLPNTKFLALNLNFFTGKIPEWILYHPNLMDWDPSILIFNQERNYLDSEGNLPGFSNTPETPDYYYEAYPLKKPEHYDEY